jgi:hypothetical protein
MSYTCSHPLGEHCEQVHCPLRHRDRKTSDFIIFLMGWDWVHLVWRPLFGLLYQPEMIEDGDCRAIGGRRIGRGNLSTWRKPTPVPLCPPQIPHDLTWVRTPAPEMGSRRLTAWTMHGLTSRLITVTKSAKKQDVTDQRFVGTVLGFPCGCLDNGSHAISVPSLTQLD